MGSPRFFFNHKVVIFLVFLLLVKSVTAQLSPLQKNYDWVMPQASPKASVLLKLGVTDIKIDYHRPFVRGRQVLGKLIPLGKVWRAGANEATKISFSTSVLIEGQKIPAGTYGLFMLPNENEWEVIFNKVSEQWGAFTYKQSADFLRVKVKPQTAQHQEALEYRMAVISGDSAEISLNWGKLKIPFKISVDSIKLAKTKAFLTFNWQTAWFAANYFFNEKRDLDEALKWSKVGVALNESYSTLIMKARVLGEMKRNTDAIKTAEKAIQVAKNGKRKIPTTYAEKLISGWKK